MEEKISTIKKVELKKEDMLSMVMFDRGMTATDLKFLEEEFGFYKKDADTFTASYKNVGVVFGLKAVNDEMAKDWKLFILKIIKKSVDFDKFHNIFVSKNYDKVLLVTNKRLLKIDLKKLNEKIEDINFRIESYDEKVMNEMATETKEEHKGIFGKIVEVLSR
jgi:hypothetical protein